MSYPECDRSCFKMYGTHLVFLLLIQRKKPFVTLCLPPYMTKLFQHRVFSKRKEFAPRGANSFLKELTPIEKRCRNEINRVASPESIPIHL